MNLSSIREEVKLIVADDGFTDAQVDYYINQALFDAVGRCLPASLKGIDTAVTSTTLAYVNLSSLDGGFSGRLLKVFNSDGTSITIYPTLDGFMLEYGLMDEVGEVEACCLEGNVLWYANIPSVAETLTVLYYKNPTTLSADGDVSTEIPEFCQRNVLVHGACAMMFDVFEDGLDGAKVNAASHRMHYESGFTKMLEWMGRRKQHYIYSDTTWGG